MPAAHLTAEPLQLSRVRNTGNREVERGNPIKSGDPRRRSPAAEKQKAPAANRGSFRYLPLLRLVVVDLVDFDERNAGAAVRAAHDGRVGTRFELERRSSLPSRS